MLNVMITSVVNTKIIVNVLMSSQQLGKRRLRVQKKTELF